MNHDINKRRIGLILPSVNIRMEPELYRCPQLSQFNFYSTRVMLDDTTEETLCAMENDLEHAAKLLATIFPEVVIYGCTSGSFINGINGNINIINTIRRECHCPVVTASQAMVDAINVVSAKKITLITPYTDDINLQEKSFLMRCGIEVCAMKGLQLVSAEDIRTTCAEDIINLVVQTDSPDSEAVFISCTNVEGFQICDNLERILSKPVITSNIACVWSMLKSIKCSISIENHGMLLRDYL